MLVAELKALETMLAQIKLAEVMADRGVATQPGDISRCSFDSCSDMGASKVLSCARYRLKTLPPARTPNSWQFRRSHREESAIPMSAAAAIGEQ